MLFREIQNTCNQISITKFYMNHKMPIRMRLIYFTVYTILRFLQVTKLTNGLPTCDTTDKERLECFTCSDVSIHKCTDSKGADQFKRWNSILSAKGEINTTRYYYHLIILT